MCKVWCIFWAGNNVSRHAGKRMIGRLRFIVLISSVFCPNQWKQARSSAVLSQMMWHLPQMFHTLVGERKSLKQSWLPQSLAFVPPRKHSSLEPEQLLLKNKGGKTSALSCQLFENSFSGTADLNKCLLYKSHNSYRLHAPVQADLCVSGKTLLISERKKPPLLY